MYQEELISQRARPRYKADEEQSHQPEIEDATPDLLKIIYGTMGLMLLAIGIYAGVQMLSWALLNPWMAVGMLLLTGVVLGWMGAVWLTWTMESKLFSFMLVVVGVMLIFTSVMGYGAYQSWVGPAATELNELGR